MKNRPNSRRRREKPKIIHVITRLDMGGSAQNTLQSCIGLAPNYDTLLVYGPTHESRMTFVQQTIVARGLDATRESGVRLRVVPALLRAIHPFFDLVALVSLYRLFRREKPDIVHTHTSKAGLLGRWAAKLAGVPHILHTAHGHVFHGHFNTTLSRVFLIIEKITAHITDRMIALTKGEGQDYLRLGVVKPYQLETIHSGVQIQRFFENAKTPHSKADGRSIANEQKVVGTVGWLLPIKGSMVLFDAMRRVWSRQPNTLLIYVGQGSEKERIERKASRLNLAEKIEFLGWRADIETILPSFDIFVLPSLNEGMGRAIVEAMASGLPVVASNTGGIPDLVQKGENGYVVPPGDEAALAEAISTLLEDPDLAQRMGAVGRERCHRFSLSSMLDQLDRLYQEVLTTET